MSYALLGAADLISAAAANKEETGLFVIPFYCMSDHNCKYFFISNQVQSDMPEQQHFIHIYQPEFL